MTCEKITGIILAGGKARRMQGFPKGKLILDAQTFIQHILNAFRPIVQNVFIIANDKT